MHSSTDAYVHGYDARAAVRLRDQAHILEPLLHSDTRYSPGSRVLEVGCGVGAQTVALARNSPGARFFACDISASSVAEAAEAVRKSGLSNVQFHVSDLFEMAPRETPFDHAFVCFFLEHLAQPIEALAKIRQLVKPGGTITIIEGDHGSALFLPQSEAADLAIRAQVKLQAAAAGGNANIGRELFPLLRKAGCTEVFVSPRLVYADGSRPDLADGFTRKTFAAMIEGIRDRALEAGLIDAEVFDEGVRALHRAAEPDGVFCYTFFKAVGRCP